jgi:hypothetical protein
MAKRYDATTRSLFDLGPDDWLGYLGSRVPDLVEVVDSNVSMFAAEWYKAVGTGGLRPVIR